MITIKDIAEYCGVSVSTVSYVLNGHGDSRRIAPATQERVRRAAAELGYPRLGAAAAARKFPVIGIYWPARHLEMTMPAFIEGKNTVFSRELEPMQSFTLTYSYDSLSEVLHRQGGAVSDVDLIVGGSKRDIKFLRSHEPKVPTVLINRELEGYSSVTVDCARAAQLAAQTAMQNGGSDVAVVMSPKQLYGISSRVSGFLDAFSKAGIDLSGNIFYSESDIDSGYDLGWRMIRENRLHKVLFCGYDIVALGIINALNEGGIRVGEEVQVLSMSTGPQRLFARSYPSMTVVDLHFKEVSERACKLAIELAAGRISGTRQIVVQPSIVYRQSCPLTVFPEPF